MTRVAAVLVSVSAVAFGWSDATSAQTIRAQQAAAGKTSPLLRDELDQRFRFPHAALARQCRGVNQMRTDVAFMGPMQMVTVDMVPDNEGTWLLHCHVSFHNTAGMNGRYAVAARRRGTD